MSRNYPDNYRGREANEGLQYRKRENRLNYGQDEFLDSDNSFRSEEKSTSRRDNYRNRYKEEDKWNERDMNIRNRRNIHGDEERSANPYQTYRSEDDFPYQTQYENVERDPNRMRQMREEQVRSQYMENRDDTNYRRSNFSGVGPKSYKKSDDRIEEDVCNALMRDRHVNASQIEVNVSNGIVTLSGTVDSRSARFDAELAVDSVRGVEDIQNNLRVRKWDQDYTRRQ